MSWWRAAALDRARWQALVDPGLERVARALDSGRFPPGLLLAGPPGLGRELAAVEIAVRLVCAEAKGTPLSVRMTCGSPNSWNVRSKTVKANRSWVVASASQVRR